MMDDFEKTFHETEMKANTGDMHASDALGRMWAKGFPHAPRQDFNMAEKYLLKAHPGNGIGSLGLQFINTDGQWYSIFSGDPALAE